MWVSLSEKFYAKLHGSYEELEGRLVQDALVDLTGGSGEEIDMRSVEAQIDLASGFPHSGAHSWQSGSISFGRFENEALCWERRSYFIHNRYLEEVEKYFKPGSITEKKEYFEELFRRRALLSQSSSDCPDRADSQSSNDGSKNTDYEGDFDHVNEIGHSACFVENHDRLATPNFHMTQLRTHDISHDFKELKLNN
ncbi:hypothetical protein CQW23_31140 [Capsicum baccatum]|uniref:Calpain catalytic domain-containing protein n=1 Tax=Capsicum baccatum TaxID=33114 RepID=A0A2G2V8N7_CAPBA|nr:hypothetical protein CQW23_31140 [Capsicum baccatum]